MARINSGTASTTPAEVSISMTFCAAITVQNSGSVALLVCVPTLHGDEFDSIAASSERTYRSTGKSIERVTVKTASSTATYQISPIMGEA